MTENLDFKEEALVSGALDIYLTSDDPKIDQVIEKITEDIQFEGHQNLIKNQLRVLVLNFIKMKQAKRQGFIRYSRGNDYWSRYNKKNENPWGVSSKIDDVVDTLEKNGLIKIQPGFALQNLKRQTRISPTAQLTKRYIKPFKLLEIKLKYHQKTPIVRVHIKKEDKHTSRVSHTRFEAKSAGQPKQLIRTKQQIRKYNEFLQKVAITLDKVPETEGISKINFDLSKSVYRSFNDKELSKGGRFYGAWWIHEIKSDLRKFILINGNKTVELDYKSQHAYMAYGLTLGASMDACLKGADPYTIPYLDGTGSYPRSLGKAIFTRALNVRSRQHLRASLEDLIRESLNGTKETDKETALSCKPYIEKEFDKVMDAFEAFHDNLLKPKRVLYPLTKQDKLWGKYQFYDSQICAYVLDTLTSEKIICLSVHDSFIVEEKHLKRLMDVMKEAYKKASYTPNLEHCIPDIRTTKRT